MINPKVVIEERVAQKRSWEEIISDFMEARQAKDDSQWIMGDLALES